MSQLNPTKNLKKPVDPAALVDVVNKTGATGKHDIRCFSLDDEEGEFVKLAVFGPPGSGKTRAIADLLRAGERVFVINTDLGGTGLGTVKRLLKAEGRRDLLNKDHIQYVDLRDYNALEYFLRTPEKAVPGIWDFDPTFLAWDGGSFFQTVLLDDKILSLPAVAAGGTSNVELRNEGMFATQPDWNAMRRMTIRLFHKFLTLHSPTRLLHKYLTFQEGDTEKDKDGNPKPGAKKKPLLYTQANALSAAGFDLILHACSVQKANSDEVKYFYRTQGHDGVQAKNREFPLSPEMPADMGAVWAIIKESISTNQNPPAAVEGE